MKSLEKFRRRMVSDFSTGSIVPGSDFSCWFLSKNGTNQIVLPVEAIAREGAESFVFQQNGDILTACPIHVTIGIRRMSSSPMTVRSSPAMSIALRGAHQMQMALKNKSGGGVDPHAGHNH